MDPTKFGRKLTPMAVVKWERTEGLYAYSSDESDGKTEFPHTSTTCIIRLRWISNACVMLV